MPLRVHCPNGCLIRMPSNRAGKIVRCPECKSTIEIGPVTDTEKQSGKPIPISASRVEEAVVVSPSDPGSENEAVDLDESIASPFESADRVVEPAIPLDEQVEADLEAVASTYSLLPEPPDQPHVGQSRLGIPLEFSPVAIKKRREQHKAKLKAVLNEPDPIVEINISEQHRQGQRRPIPFPVPCVSPPPIASGFRPDEMRTIIDQPISWENRVRKSKADRVVLSRFYAISLCLVALVNTLPALYFGIQWYQALESTAIPRWIYLQIFVAAIHLLYSLFLFQLPDWSSLRAVSVAMLVIAFVFGVISTSLLVGGGQGALVTVLGLPFSMVKRATIWCVAMLCLATLMSYLGGKEAANWQRAEQLLEEILGGTPVSTSET